MPKITWRLAVALNMKCDSWDDFDYEDPVYHILEFKDEKLALEALKEAQAAAAEEWVGGEEGEEPGPLRKYFPIKHKIIIWDSDGCPVDTALALDRIQEFVKVERIYPE